MTTPPDVFAGRTAVLDRTARAQEAIKVFRTMQPQLSAFARALTGRRDMKVVLDTGTPRTDGKNIWYRPPITLGDKYKHDRSLCEKRGADKVLLCLSCAQREEVLAVIYHEIAHVAFDSFDPPTDEQRKAIITRAIKKAGGHRAEAISARIQAAPSWQTGSYRGLAGLVSEYLPFIVNCLEDARVNREMFKARPGTKVMFEVDAYTALSQGVEQQDGEVIQWRDYPLNSQVSVSLLCKAAGYTFGANLLRPQVAEAMNDSELTSLVNRMDSVRSVSGVYELSLPILSRLQDLGFCIDHPEDEPEPEPEPQPDGKFDDKSDEESDDGEGQPEEESGKSGKPDGDSDDPDDEGEAGVGDSDGDGDSDAESDRGDSDGLEDGEPGESGGSESSGEDEDGPAGDASERDAGTEPDDETESTDERGEEGTGDIGDDPESGTGEAGSGDGDGSEEPAGDTDDDSDGPDVGSGSGEGGTEESDASGSEGGEEDHDGSVTPELGGAPEASDVPSESGADVDSETDLGKVPAGDGSDKAASRSSVGDPSDDTPTPAEDGSDDADPRDDGPLSDDDTRSDVPDELDTGADQGIGGIEAGNDRDEEIDTPELGDASDAKKALKVFGGHEEVVASLEEEADNDALDVAIVQGMYFEQPSTKIHGVRVHQFGTHAHDAEGWTHAHVNQYFDERELHVTGVRCDTDISESVLGPCLTRMRVAFSDNKRSRMQPNLKAGRIRKQALGKRAWGDDGRLFQKKTIAKKRDYLVIIGIDISGSTTGTNLILAKRAAMAQAELCNRLGVKFAVYAHTAQRANMQNYTGTMSLEMYQIKGPDEPWSSKQKEAFAEIGPVADNLDGKSVEFYRRILDASTATDRIILYYSDGKMPAANHDEELRDLIREIKICKQKGYHLLGVGIRTDSPKRHGLDTVQVDSDDDLIKVVRHLEKVLLRG